MGAGGCCRSPGTEAASLLCNLPTNSHRVWADCRTKTFALAVDINSSHRTLSWRENVHPRPPSPPPPPLPDGPGPQPPARKPLRKRTWVRVTGAVLAGFTGLIIALGATSHPSPAAATTPASPPVASAPAVTAPASPASSASSAAHKAHEAHQAHQAVTAPSTPPVTAPDPGPAAPAARRLAAPAAPASQPPAAPAGPTASQQQALTSAQGYLSDGQGFSRAGLIAQLDSPYGGQFSVADATWAVDNSGADWNAQAAIAAKGYASDGQGFSRQGLIDQLDSPYGGQFTYAQAVYGAGEAGL